MKVRMYGQDVRSAFMHNNNYYIRNFSLIIVCIVRSNIKNASSTIYITHCVNLNKIIIPYIISYTLHSVNLYTT